MTGKRFANVWDAIEDSPGDAASLKMRASIMMSLQRYIERSHLTQAQAAKVFRVTQPRISNLIRGKIDLFSLDTLVDMATSAKLQIRMTVAPRRVVKTRKPRTAQQSRAA